jgi:protein TonB
LSTLAFKNVGAGTPFIIEGEYYRWNLSRSGVQVHMHTGAVRRIAYDLVRKTTAKAPSDLGGLLLGECRKLVPRTFRVMGVEPCDAESSRSGYESDNLHSVLRIMNGRMAATAGGDSVVGFCRIVEEELAFSDLDLTLARSCFPDPDKVFLLVKTLGWGRARICFFFWNNERLESEVCEFPAVECTPRVIRSRRTENAPDPPRPAPTELYSPDPSGVAAGWKRLTGPRILVLMSAITITLIATAVMWVRHTPEHTAARPAAVELNFPLGLKATALAGNLLLTWNGRAPALASARVGLMIIGDGEQHKELALDQKKLLEGGLFYTPSSETVSFTLQIFGEGVVQRESVTVIKPRRNAPPPLITATPEISVPAPPERPSQGPTPRPEAAANLPDPQAATARAVSERPADTVSSAAVQTPFPTQSAITNPPLPREQTDPMPQVVAPGPEGSQVSPGPRQSPAVPLVEPAPPSAAPIAVPPTRPESSLAVATAQPVAPYIPPRPVRQTKPVAPRSLKALISREIVIEVKVSVDATGRITRAEAPPGEGVLQNSLAKLAIEAARLWKFQPAREGNHNKPGEVRIQFQFGPG